MEQSYRLCPRCERQLKRALNRVKRNVLGSKLAEIGSNGLRALDKHVAAIAHISNNQKRQNIIDLCLIVAFLLSAIGLMLTMQDVHINRTKLDTTFNPFCTSIILWTLSHMTAAKIIGIKFLTYLTRLPYIAQCMQLFNNSVGGMHIIFAHYITNVTITNDLNNNVIGNVSASADLVAIMNVSGCMISTMIVCMQGIHIGTVINVLLWSLNMLLPSVFHKSAGLQIELIVDLAKIAIMSTVTITSLCNIISNRMPTPELTNSGQNNNSFHRIGDDQSDVSDESDIETDLNTSQQSMRSSRSMDYDRSNLFNTSHITSAPSIYSSVSKNNLNLSSSSDRLLDQHPAIHANGLFSSQQSLISNFTSISHRPHHRLSDPSRLMPSTSSAFAASHAPSMDSMVWPNRAPSRLSNYDIPDDFQSGITQLSIGTTRQRLQEAKRANPSLFTNTIASGTNQPRQRRHFLQPSKLNYIEDKPSLLGAHQTSWVAGGFWNQAISPQKRHSATMSNGQPPSIIGTPPSSALPVISRTSSRSSGFESLKNGQTNDWPTLNDDHVESESILAETTFMPQPAFQRVNAWQMRNSTLPNYHSNSYDGDNNSMSLRKSLGQSHFTANTGAASVVNGQSSESLLGSGSSIHHYRDKSRSSTLFNSNRFGQN